jgi:hypothetical protein
MANFEVSEVRATREGEKISVEGKGAAGWVRLKMSPNAAADLSQAILKALAQPSKK